VLFSCVGPAGDVVCTGAGDENLKFWRVWDLAAERSLGKKKRSKSVMSSGFVTGEEVGGGRMNSTKEGILSIR